MIKRFAVVVLVIGLCAVIAQAHGEKLYWTTWSGDYTGVWRANIDGTEQEQILSLEIDSLDGIAVDLPRRKLYISTGYDLLRSNLDGSGLETIISGIGDYAVYGVEVDSAGQKVYWSTWCDGGGIRRANLDGSSIETVFVPPVSGDLTYHMAIDQPGQKLHFAGLDYVYRADLDGANPEVLLANPDPGLLAGMDLDVENGKMYFTTWPSTLNGHIYRADLDGSDLEVLVGDKTFDVALDTEAGKMYWPAWASIGPNNVMRANLDGTEVEAICPLMGSSNALAFVVPELATVVLDIKPGSDPNSVNLKSKGVLPVVAYGSDQLDVTEIDLDTLLLNGVGPRLMPDGSWHVSLEDVDGDLLLDLLMHFQMQALGIEPGTTELALTGALMDGTEFEGADVIRIVPDFNGDLMVNATDLAIMNQSYGTAGVGFELGDANADGFVDATDLALLRAGLGWPESAFGEPIPEPATLSLLALGGLAMLRRRNK